MATPWVCLMYHDIVLQEAGSGGGPNRFAVPIGEFRRQLDQLQSEGLAGCSLRAALQPGVERVVAITFDDGDTGQYERGFRALAERGMTATFFVTTDWIGRPGYVTWGQLREMRAGGMDVQSHSRSHPFLSELGAPELTSELRGSKDALDAGLGQDTDMLALPGGDWPRGRLRHLIAAAGYRVVATSRWGTTAPPRGEAGGLVPVPRCTVQGVPGPYGFRQIVAGNAALGRQRRIRESTLGLLRGALGPSRYASWRRAVLNVLG